jgi:hypothetical protein
MTGDVLSNDLAGRFEGALRLNVGAVIRRLGFLLETCSLETPESVRALQSRLTPTYEPLDNTA